MGEWHHQVVFVLLEERGDVDFGELEFLWFGEG